MSLLKRILGLGNSQEQIKEMLSRGAVIIDVRSPGEFRGGHIPDSRNIPLNELPSRTGEIRKMKKPVILCCASGARSRMATSTLKGQGIECVNGGGWSALDQMIRS